MNEPTAFEMEVAERGADAPPMLVDVEGFEGPLDLLLALARQLRRDVEAWLRASHGALIDPD